MNLDQPEGVLLIDKPTGITSHDVVDRVRRAFQMKKVGHAGTLDPMATGLLIILVGRATKVSQFLMSLGKTYAGTGRLGQVTDSQDADGEIVEESPIPDAFEVGQLESGMKTFRGDQYQTPPMFSAKKIKGVPLYKLARKGKEVEREPRFIHISQFQLESYDRPDFRFTLSCSKGTYVRTVVHDLGQQLGCGAHLIRLRRTEIDRFSVEDAIALDALEEASPLEKRKRLIPVHAAVPSHVL
mgnify:CR=1 FL=1